MKYVITIENEPKLLAQVAESLYLSDSKLIIRNFNTFDGFQNWLLYLKQNGSSAINQAGYTLEEALESSPLFQKIENIRKKNESKSIKVVGKELNEHLLLLIIKLEMLSKEQIEKLAETLKLFESTDLNTPETTTTIVFTAFESPNFKLKEFLHPYVGNILFKPFDIPILNQQLFYALNGNQDAKSEFVFQQKTNSIIEMIKEAESEGYSELGLITKSAKPIQPGVFSKLYSKSIETDAIKSSSTVCVFSEAHPSDPQSFLNYFKFFAIKNEQLVSIRKNIKESKTTKFKNFKKPLLIDKMGRFFHVAIICIDDSAQPIEETLIRNFKLLKVSKYKDTLEFIKLMKSEPFAVDTVIFVNSFFTDDPQKQTQNFRETATQHNPLFQGEKSKLFPIFLISNHIYPKEAEKELSQFVTNIFYNPLDRAYFLKQFYLELNFLLFKEMPIELQYVPSHQPLKIGYAVEIIDLSEAAIDFHYVKALPRNEFRKFILTGENENQMMEILGKCYFVKENKEKETFEHKFIFFSLNDFFLKSIRLWIRNTYIQSKEGSSQ